MTRSSLRLPDFPWDSLAQHRARAAEHPDGIVDLSVGSPVDETPQLVRAALAAAGDAHAYPLTAGSRELDQAIVDWFARRGIDDLSLANVLPVIGSKELIALLPLMLGVKPGQVVVQPAIAYPTYAIGAALVGAHVVASDDPAEWPAETALVWVNSPGNPTGAVMSAEQLRAAVARARELGAIIVNDECYTEFSYASDAPTPSILDFDVIRGRRTGVLSIHSLSKRSNMAGYRAGFLAGCSDLISDILAVRKHLGLMPPAPIQAAMAAALGDDAHVREQRDRYAARRARLIPALEDAGYRIDASEAGLYLWVTDGTDAWATVARFAEAGILVVPGSFYSVGESQHVRIALTATDAAVEDAARRIDALGA